MTQCSVSMTLAHVIEFGERKWENICENEFNQLSAGIVYFIINSSTAFRISITRRCRVPA